MSEVIESRTEGGESVLPDLPEDERRKQGWDKAERSPLALRALKRIERMGEGNGLSKDDIIPEWIEEQDCEAEGMLTLRLRARVEWDEKSKHAPADAQQLDSMEDLAKLLDNPLNEKLDGRPVRDLALEYATSLPFKGFGAKNGRFELKGAGRNIVIRTTCQDCQGTGHSVCSTCYGHGRIKCRDCQGDGEQMCHFCHGQREITQPDGSKSGCTVCGMRGFIPCKSCQGRGQIVCPTCSGKVKVVCATCKGQGEIPKFGRLHFAVEQEFTIRQVALPKEVSMMLRKVHPLKILRGGHAKITGDRIDRTADLHPIIRYDLAIPYAAMRTRLGPRSWNFSVIGHRGKIVGLGGFLDKLIEGSVKKMEQTIVSQGNVVAMLRNLENGRVIQKMMSNRLKRPDLSAMQIVRGSCPIGLSPEMKNRLVKVLDNMIGSLTERDKKIGVWVAAAATFGVSLVWHLTEIRQGLPLLSGLSADFVLGVVCVLFGILGGRYMAARALAKALGRDHVKLPSEGGDLAKNVIILAISFVLPYLIMALMM